MSSILLLGSINLSFTNETDEESYLYDTHQTLSQSDMIYLQNMKPYTHNEAENRWVVPFLLRLAVVIFGRSNLSGSSSNR